MPPAHLGAGVYCLMTSMMRLLVPLKSMMASSLQTDSYMQHSRFSLWSPPDTTSYFIFTQDNGPSAAHPDPDHVIPHRTKHDC